MADSIHPEVHDDYRTDQFDLRFLDVWHITLAIPCVHKRVSLPYRLVCGVSGNSNSRSVCDPNPSESPQKSTQPRVVVLRTASRHRGRRAAVHCTRYITALYTAAHAVTGDDYSSDRNVSV